MAIPVIHPLTSVLSYPQWHPWEFQPLATNSPESWAITSLPPGIELNAETGLISGAGTVDAIYNVGLTATNGSGTSAELVFPIRITPASAPLTTAGNLIDVDVATRLAKFVNAERLFSKAGDDLLLFLRYKHGETVIDPDINNVQLNLKELISEPVIITGSSWHKVGSGTGAFVILHVHIAAAGVAGALSNWEEDNSKQFTGKAEIETIFNYSLPAWSGAPATIRMSTEDFLMTIAADMGEVAVDD